MLFCQEIETSKATAKVNEQIIANRNLQKPEMVFVRKPLFTSPIRKKINNGKIVKDKAFFHCEVVVILRKRRQMNTPHVGERLTLRKQMMVNQMRWEHLNEELQKQNNYRLL